MLTRTTVVAVRMALATVLLLGLAYPLAVTGVAGVALPHQAGGSLVTRDGAVVGSELIGQSFSGARYFAGRPSAAGAGYDATASGASNLAPTDRRLHDRVRSAVASATAGNPGLVAGQVPVDMVTTSGSGLDPDITLANAYAQARRVADARGMNVTRVRDIIERTAVGRQFGIFGEPRVNVLALNLALDAGE